MENNRREDFAKKLCSLYDVFNTDGFDVAHFNHEIMKAFLDFEGDDDESKKCTELIEFGGHQANISAELEQYGFKLRGQTHTFLSGILSTLAYVRIPETVEFRDRYPDLTQEQWEAVMMMCGAIISAFNPYRPVSKDE